MKSIQMTIDMCITGTSNFHSDRRFSFLSEDIRSLGRSLETFSYLGCANSSSVFNDFLISSHIGVIDIGLITDDKFE